jgi:AT-binding transcription factor 1
MTSSSASDIEEFQGKIVYNPDGSAYIIEDADLSEDEALLDLPRQEGSIVEKLGQEPAEVDQFPTIENAIYVARTKSNYPSYVRAQASRLLADRPTVHSYRVYNYRQGGASAQREEQRRRSRLDIEAAAAAGGMDNVPVKPILMCFICKLSFGNAKSFKTHCSDEHSLDFNEEEVDMLQLENISALIQPAGRDKSPLLSFLEPVASSRSAGNTSSSSTAYLLPSDQPVPNQQPLHSPAKSPGGEGGIRVRNDLAAFGGSSQISPVSNGGRSSTSPGVHSLSPSPSSFNQLGGPFGSKGATTIGACPEHLQSGRPTGVECAKCDLILSATAAANRLAGGPAAAAAGWNASNNACKTLKCPKCNWHYKYQETLEIHMKEKHPESETTCIYCITGQQHPRLARGETYTCGYKPYRCEICNYSTTTKGNLSIHMQSDKHINNMQELQNSGGGGGGGSNSGSGGVGAVGESVPSPSPSQGSKYATPSTTPKPPEDCKENSNKPCWRCDVCNYETNIARNLRIHMTSEKHMNNVMNLQQLQGLEGGMPGMSPFPNVPPPSAAAAAAANLQHLLGMSMMPGGLTSSPLKEAAMADMAFNQALLMQMMGAGGGPGGPPGLPGHPMPPLPFLPSPADGGQDPADMDQADPNPRYLYNCAVCREFSCDHLQSLSDHLAVDRTKLRETEVSILIGGTYICKLCSYKTNLKANFQLHCKTDKHLQKLQLVNHIMEGGPTNEWKLNFMNVSNSVQLRCNACDFYTDSIHKLQIHSANQGHEVSAAIFGHLRKAEQQLAGSQQQLSYNCTICSHGAAGKALLLQHCRSVKHLQMEQLHLLQRRAEGAAMHPEIGDIFTVTIHSDDRDTEPTEAQGIVTIFIKIWQGCRSFQI